jgi:nitroreductase
MEVFDCIVNRRSVRAYEQRNVPDEILLKLIDAGRWAPSAGNIQPLLYLIATSATQIRKIKAFSPGMIFEPPAIIVICIDLDLATKKGGKLGRELLAIFDAGMAAQNIMLYATDLGLGTCAVRSFNPPALQPILKLPENVVPQLLVGVGYPAQQPIVPKRKDLGELVRWDTYLQEGDRR